MNATSVLPSGRHHLSREAVAESQYHRMLVAVVEVVGERGWAATRVADVVRTARVSRQTFYEHFGALDACFAEALEVGMAELLAGLDDEAAKAPIADADDLRARLLRFFEGYAAALSAFPGLPVAAHVETLRSSDLVRERRARLITVLSERIRRAYEAARRSDPALRKLPDTYFVMLTGGFDELLREAIRTQGAERALAAFAGQASTLAAMALAPVQP